MTELTGTAGRETVLSLGEPRLGACSLLKDLSTEDLRVFERSCGWISLPAETVVFRHGDAPDAVYFVASGAVRIFFRDEHDREVNYAQLGPGDMFGELAVLDGLERSADVVVSAGETVLATCSREAFVELLHRHPSIAIALLVRLAAIIRAGNQKMFSFSILSGVQRVYLELLRTAMPDPSGDGSWLVTPAPLHKEIAAWAGTTTDVVGRAFGNLMRANLMRRHSGNLKILDRRRLEALTRESPEDA